MLGQGYWVALQTPDRMRRQSLKTVLRSLPSGKSAVTIPGWASPTIAPLHFSDLNLGMAVRVGINLLFG